MFEWIWWAGAVSREWSFVFSRFETFKYNFGTRPHHSSRHAPVLSKEETCRTDWLLHRYRQAHCKPLQLHIVVPSLDPWWSFRLHNNSWEWTTSHSRPVEGCVVPLPSPQIGSAEDHLVARGALPNFHRARDRNSSRWRDYAFSLLRWPVISVSLLKSFAVVSLYSPKRGNEATS